MKMFRKLMKNEKGATAIEYGLIAALIAVAMVTAVGQFSDALNGTFIDAADELTDATA